MIFNHLTKKNMLFPLRFYRTSLILHGYLAISLLSPSFSSFFLSFFSLFSFLFLFFLPFFSPFSLFSPFFLSFFPFFSSFFLFFRFRGGGNLHRFPPLRAPLVSFNKYIQSENDFVQLNQNNLKGKGDPLKK